VFGEKKRERKRIRRHRLVTGEASRGKGKKEKKGENLEQISRGEARQKTKPASTYGTGGGEKNCQSTAGREVDDPNTAHSLQWGGEKRERRGKGGTPEKAVYQRKKKKGRPGSLGRDGGVYYPSKCSRAHEPTGGGKKGGKG